MKNAMAETEARGKVGDDLVNQVLAQNCQFTGRLLDNPEVVEMSASINFIDPNDEARVLSMLYMVDAVAAYDTDDLGSLDYSNYTFEIA